jgi:hypothetical protein
VTRDTSTIDEWLSALDEAVQKRGRRGDAIDEVLASPGRVTGVRSIKDSPQAEAFRQAVVDGLIRTDVVHKLLGLINEVVLGVLK